MEIIYKNLYVFLLYSKNTFMTKSSKKSRKNKKQIS